jgi:predicted deacylase
MKKLLITTATHGDEGFSVPIVKKLAQKFPFDWQINNPRALAQNRRFIDIDLNRVGPGIKNSRLYEESRAWEILTQSKKYKVVIDIHGTTSNSGVFIILSDPNWSNVELAKSLPIQNVVLWPSLQPKGPLTQFINNSLEIECGPKDDPNIADELEKILNWYLSGKQVAAAQTFYIVTGMLKGVFTHNMRDFELTSLDEQSFYPLLVDQYEGITCYTMQRLGNTLAY